MPAPNLTATSDVRLKLLYSGQLASGDTTIYTSGASKSATVKKLVLTNVSTSAVTVPVSAVPAGQTADVTRRVVSGYVLAAGESITITELEGAGIGGGDFLSVNASAATAVNVMLSGQEMS